jgi:hypothetical protein
VSGQSSSSTIISNASDASDDTGSKNNSDADKIKQLQQEVDYLKQEMEFLKKISSIRTTRK